MIHRAGRRAGLPLGEWVIAMGGVIGVNSSILSSSGNLGSVQFYVR